MSEATTSGTGSFPKSQSRTSAGHTPSFSASRAFPHDRRRNSRFNCAGVNVPPIVERMRSQREYNYFAAPGGSSPPAPLPSSGARATEIDGPGAHRVAQPAEQVLQEQRLRVRRFRVPHVGVPRAPAVEIVIPAHRVMRAVRPSLVARFVDLDEHADGRIDRLEV